ncbi:MAG: hypothetical protein ACJ8F7_06385 [Gemmataceae bacterium]
MAKLNLNSVLCNVQVNDNVVTARMAIGSQLPLPAAASLSHGRPEPTGPEMPETYGGIHMALAVRDTNATRIGRSVRPAGCRGDLGRSARSAKRHEWQGFAAPLAVSGQPTTGSR